MRPVALLKKCLRLLVLALLLGSFLLWQNFSLAVEQEIISLTALPEGFSGLRILHISDLHGRIFGPGHQYLLREAEASQPDLICITGDLFEAETELSSLEPLIRGLCRLAPVYYVTGNHEWQRRDLAQCLLLLEEWGAEVLQNEYRLLEREGSRLALLGVDDPCGPYDQKRPEEVMQELRQELGEDCFVLALDHRNDRLALWQTLGADLVLSGHCHGGVVRLPLVGGLIGPGRSWFPDYDAGLYRAGETQLYVSRGLGFPLRLFNRPQLPILVLNRK